MTTRRWLLAGLFAVLITVFILDQGLKTSPGGGFVPVDAEWHAATADFPRLWGELEASAPFAALQERIPRPLHPLEVAVHERTGVRPTAMRWAVWMGRHAAAAGTSDTWGICVRPGVLLHGIHGLRRLAGIGPSPDGMYTYAGVHYGWRQGFLILSGSPDFVTASLDPERGEAIGRGPSDAAHIRWRPQGVRPLEVSVHARDELHLAAIVEGDFSVVDAPPMAPVEDWQEPMLLALGAAQADHLAALRDAVRDWSRATPAGDHAIRVLDEVWQRWDLPPLRPDWDQEVRGVALGLDAHFRGSLLPEAGAVARFHGVTGASGPHPLDSWLDALDPIPYEWDGMKGECAALLGGGLALCAGGAGSPWLAASNEPLMASAAARAASPGWVEADVVISLNWRRVATLLRQGLLMYARNELIPGHDMTTLEEEWGEWLEALAAMGVMHLEGRVVDGALHLAGPLTGSATGHGRW